ncbi:hypothetical protein MIMGU_mgv1a0185822mg, partial [Erythranthe guttata]
MANGNDRNRQPETGKISIESKSPLPNFHQSVRLKYVKLGYRHLISHAVVYLLLLPLLAMFPLQFSSLTTHDLLQLWDLLKSNSFSFIVCSTLIVFLATLHFMTRPRKVYLVDFACYKPEEVMCSKEMFMDRSIRAGTFTQENLDFQKRIMERSRLGQKTYFPEALMRVPASPSMAEARKEAQMVMFGAIDDLLAKTGIRAKDIGILVVNCSLFNPTPSLSAMSIIHKRFTICLCKPIINKALTHKSRKWLPKVISVYLQHHMQLTHSS